jgi:hypothetical protein
MKKGVHELAFKYTVSNKKEYSKKWVTEHCATQE